MGLSRLDGINARRFSASVARHSLPVVCFKTRLTGLDDF